MTTIFILAVIICVLSFCTETFTSFITTMLIGIALGYISTKPWETKVTYGINYIDQKNDVKSVETQSVFIYIIYLIALAIDKNYKIVECYDIQQKKQ